MRSNKCATPTNKIMEREGKVDGPADYITLQPQLEDWGLISSEATTLVVLWATGEGEICFLFSATWASSAVSKTSIGATSAAAGDA
jgi:hypothetical protein